MFLGLPRPTAWHLWDLQLPRAAASSFPGDTAGGCPHQPHTQLLGSHISNANTWNECEGAAKQRDCRARDRCHLPMRTAGPSAIWRLNLGSVPGIPALHNVTLWSVNCASRLQHPMMSHYGVWMVSPDPPAPHDVTLWSVDCTPRPPSIP